jgi:hypothetical protein
MSTTLRSAARRAFRRLPVVRLLALAAVLLAQTGCATSDADLDYTRDKPTDEAPKDHSYHGWNDNNY